MREQQKKQYGGYISHGARKRLAKAVTIMAQGCQPKWKQNPATGYYEYHALSFLTLTIHSPNRLVSFREAYDKCLAPFLQWLRREHDVKTYVWKGELQNRKQPHYHITFPNMIHWREVRDKWNELQKNAGYLDEYIAEHGHSDANSTDIHRVDNRKAIAKYIVKEMMKDVDARRMQVKSQLIENGVPPDQLEKRVDEIVSEEMKVNGKCWDCSNNLSGVAYFAVNIDKEKISVYTSWLEMDNVYFKDEDFFKYIDIANANLPPPWDCLLNKEEREQFFQYTGEICYTRDQNPMFEINDVPQADEDCVYSYEQLVMFKEEWLPGIQKFAYN